MKKEIRNCIFLLCAVLCMMLVLLSAQITGYAESQTDISLSSAEALASEQVCTVSDYNFWFYPKDDCYNLIFAFKDKNGNIITEPIPANVNLKIINDLDIVVLEKDIHVTAENYTTWTWNTGKDTEYSKYMATISIQPNEIAKGETLFGKAVFTIENPYFTFEEEQVEIDELPLDLSLSSKEIETSKRIYHISDCDFIYYEKGDYYDLMFAFKDTDKNYVTDPVPLIVNVKIVNDQEITVYEKNVHVSAKDYSSWTWNRGKDNEYSKYMANVYIQPDEIELGKTNKGTVYYSVMTSYGWWKDRSIDTDDLPTKGITIELPELPKTVTESNGVTTKILNITYEAKLGYDGKYAVTLFFTGEKMADKKGENIGTACRMSWKLKDSEGYVVESDTTYSDSVVVGEKFKNKKDYIYDLEPDDYTLIIYESTSY